MRIEDFRSESNVDRTRIVATVIWEDCDRAPFDLYFETVNDFADALYPGPEPFAVACIVPALHFGERRMLIDSQLCPELRAGLYNAMSWLHHWYYPSSRQLVQIEAGTNSNVAPPNATIRSGLLFSGGVDSLFTLRSNHIGFPTSHERRIQDGILAFGLELDDLKAFHCVELVLREIADVAGITLIPVYTNLYLQYRSADEKNGFQLWYREFMGAALAAIGHALANRLSTVTIASDYDIPNQRPHGSHPALDPNYGSAALRIQHDGHAYSRFEKTRLLADWPVALNKMRVCNLFRNYGLDELNCGRCEKCIRTMLALEALGVLDKATAFPRIELTADYLRNNLRMEPAVEPLYGELTQPLRHAGRDDLGAAIQDCLALSRRTAMKQRWRRKFKHWDERYFDGRLLTIKKSLGGPARSKDTKYN